MSPPPPAGAGGRTAPIVTPGAYARALAAECAGSGMQLLLGSDQRLGRLLGQFEMVAARWDAAAIRAVACYRPSSDEHALTETRVRVASLLAWGEAQLDRRGSGRCDILLVVTTELAPTEGLVTGFGDVHLSLAWVDASQERAECIAGSAEGVPDAKALRAVAAGIHRRGAPSFSAVLDAERVGRTEPTKVARAGRVPRLGRSPGSASEPTSRRAREAAALSGAAPDAMGATGVGSVVPSVVSLVFSLLVIAQLSGWRVALGVTALIAVHELGHICAAWTLHVPVSAPVFLGPFGAFVRHSRVETPRRRAILALAGPAFGVGAALACIGIGLALPTATLSPFLLAIGRWGCVVNLINCVPASILDGNTILPAVSRWSLGVITLLAVATASVAVVTSEMLSTALPGAIAAVVAAYLALRLRREPWQAEVARSLLLNVAVVVVVAAALAGSIAGVA